MSGKRNLPSWMSACDSKGRKEEPEKKRQKPAANINRTKRAERLMLYWMNERELMETALSVLQKNDTKTEACLATKVSVIPETDTEEEPDLEAEDKCCRSDSDVDVAEQETLPYTTCLVKKRSTRRSDQDGDPHLSYSKTQEKEPELESSSQRTKPDPEDLQLVREIFFS